MKNLKDFYSSLSSEFKNNLMLILISYFTALFCYPMIRSITTTQFLQAYGAASTPKAWLIAVLGLTVVISICNKLQMKIGVQRLFLSISIFSSLLFLISFLFLQAGNAWFSYLLYIWKEIYIVIIIHLIFAYSNTCFSLEQMKRLYGIIGGLGSLGGVIGGIITVYVVKSFGPTALMYLSIVIIFINGFLFLKTKKIIFVENIDKKLTPLSSIKNIKMYVFLVASVVALSQFVINIADLQFNILFDKAVIGVVEKTAYQGKIHTWINFVALILQLVLIPYFFVRVSNRVVQYSIPIFYLILTVAGLGIGGAYLLPVALSFIFLKATDYSVFAVSKEILYHALSPLQKYGTKYITDMVVYRAAKAGIAVVLIYVQDLTILRIMSIAFLILWLSFLFLLFKKQQKLIED